MTGFLVNSVFALQCYACLIERLYQCTYWAYFVSLAASFSHFALVVLGTSSQEQKSGTSKVATSGKSHAYRIG